MLDQLSLNTETRTWTVYGKWILAGEHAVLRGVPALVFPVRRKFLKLNYIESAPEFKVTHSGAHGEELRLLFLGVLERALGQLGKKLANLHGEFQLENQIPLGAGLGASAAICVATGRWLQGQGYVQESQMHEFCRQLENLFHGESSGVDIAVALQGRGLKFRRGGEQTPLDIKWTPKWYLSYCGHRGITAECVTQVKNLLAKDPRRGQGLDEQMRQAVEGAQLALSKTESEGYSILRESIELAGDCFQEWGLTGGPLGKHLEKLRRAGATAVKPTGSGGGGFALSLWNSPAPTQVDGSELIPIF